MFYTILPAGLTGLPVMAKKGGDGEFPGAMQEMFLEDPQRATDALVLGLGHHRLR